MSEDLEGAVAIVGMAALFPAAPDISTFWSNIVEGRDAITPVPESRWDPEFFDPAHAGAERFYCRRGGFVDDIAIFDAASFRVMPVTVDSTEPDQLISLQVASAALEDAGGADRLIGDPRRAGVVLGRGGYYNAGVVRLDQRIRVAQQVVTTLREIMPDISQEELDEVRNAFRRELGPELPEAMIGMVPNLTASRVANNLNLSGPAYTVDAACASSLVAVDQAVRELRSGRCDVMFAGGTHHCHEVTFWSVFTQLGALSPSETIRPLDRRADGLLIGEGTGVVVLERLADAERHGHRVYAVIRGAGVASDGHHTSLMKPATSGQLLALGRAWEDSGLDPATIGLVEAHGTATPTGDDAELATLAAFFGPAEGAAGREAESPTRPGLGSVKSMIGHAMPAAGIAGLIKMALALHHRVLPPTLHCDEPNPLVGSTRFRVLGSAEPWETTGGPRRAAVNAFGFGGINAHVVLEEVPDSMRQAGPHARSAPAGRAGMRVDLGTAASPAGVALPVPGSRLVTPGDRVLLFAGDDADEVLAQLGTEADDAALCARDDLSLPAPTGPVRLAVVEPTVKRLALARRVVLQGKPWRGRNDLWFSTDGLLSGGAGGKVAFLFPGVEPVFSPQVDDVAEFLGVPAPDISTGGIVGYQAAAIVTVGRLLDRALRECGVEPAVSAGHSIGELTALVAVGLTTGGDFDRFITGMDLARVDLPDTLFAALGCGAAEAAEAIGGLERVVVSHDNCPRQSVICGDEGQVREAMDRLRRRGVLCQEMPFRSGFHSPMFEPHLAPILEQLSHLPVLRPRSDVWSTTIVAPYPEDPDEVRALARRHLLEPVRFRQLVERLFDDGVRAFVQVGTGSLTGFVDDTLHGRPVLALDAGTAKREGIDQLRRVLAALWVEGLEGMKFGLLASGPAAGSRTVGAAPAEVGRRLRLGGPLIRLGASVRLDRPRAGRQAGTADLGARAVRETDTPLLAELDAVLAEVSGASRDVVDAFQRTSLGGSAGGFGEAAPQARPDPVVGTDDGGRVLRVSMASMPWLIDHAFFFQPPGWPDVSDRFPVVPMANILKILGEEACRAVPGTVMTGLHSVRALRWTTAEVPVDVPLRFGWVSDREVKVSLEGYARGTVVLGDAYAPAPPVDLRPLADERPTEKTAREMYEERWMFHGPAYQSVVELTAISDDGIRGVLECREGPGSLLDGAAQMVGYWVHSCATQNQLALPSTAGNLAFYGPHPAVGERLECVVRVTQLNDQHVVADIEISREGRLWCKVERWEERRFTTDTTMFKSFMYPEKVLLGEPRPGGWELLHDSGVDAATRELLMRNHMNEVERRAYQALNPRQQRQRLLGRIVAKSAVRRHLGAAPAPDGSPPTREAIFPAEIPVLNDERGVPYVASRLQEAAALHVSISHTDRMAVALVGEGVPVGIDVEKVGERHERFEQFVLTEAERSLVPAGGPERDTVLTRLWCVKEAAAKAAGTGLEWRPKQFVVTELSEGRYEVAGRRIDTEVLKTGEGEFIVAWTAI